MQTLSEYVPKADWFCAECKLKQKVSTYNIALISSHALVKQSQFESNKWATESSNAESLLQRDSSLVAFEWANSAICAESQHIDVSMHSKDGLASKWTFWMIVKFSRICVRGFWVICWPKSAKISVKYFLHSK